MTVPELPGAISQARHLDQVPGDVAEVIEVMTGESHGTYVLLTEPLYPGAAGAAEREAVALRQQADEITNAASSAVRNAVIALRSDGLTLRDSAALTGISCQRAQQIERSAVDRAG